VRRRELRTALTLTLFSSFVACGAAFAADSDPSLDPMWTDPAPEKKAASASAGSAANASTGAAPLCSVDSLKQSALIKTGGWPGIGPFKADGNEYVDAGLNRLKVESEKDKITSAELRLNNQNKNTAIFNLEMSTDFLLESLGAKEARISDFNGQLEKNRVQLLQSTEVAPLNLSAGSYSINMHPEPDKTSPDRYSFIIKVSSKDAGSDLIKRNSSGAAASTSTTPSTAATTTTATTKASASDTTAENGWESTKTATAAETTAPKVTASRPTASNPRSSEFQIETPTTKSSTTKIATLPTTTTTQPKSTQASTPSSTQSSTQSPSESASTTDEANQAAAPTTLKDTFRDVIFGWQKLKKVAVRQRDTSELSQVLSGKALIRQSDAIKWLQTNKKYYDMNPKSVVVDRYVDLGKGLKYAVYAQVKESSKYMDEPTGQIIKDSDDTYNVNYTIEKSGDKWLISDSAIATAPIKATTNKTR
jgi:hypothetical protein